MGRRKLSEKCLGVALKYLPKGYTYSYRKALTGRCCRGRRWISAPKPVTRRALAVWLHECHHDNAYSEFPRYYAEYQCEMFAIRTMEKEGIEVHPKTIESARAYVKKRLEKEVRGGLAREKISPEIAEWCGYSEPQEVVNALPVTMEIKKRLKKCLALAASDNENEAALAMEKAREIMNRYSLRTADLDDEGTCTIEQRIISGSTKSVQLWEAGLAGAVAGSFDGACLYQQAPDGWKLFFMAARTDLEIIVDLFERIRARTLDMSKRYVAAARQGKNTCRIAPITLHNSYRRGVVDAVRTRLLVLQEATRPEPVVAAGGLGCSRDLIVVKRDAVNDFLNKEHPRVGKAKRINSRTSHSAYSAGRQDGATINLHRSMAGGEAPLAIGAFKQR